MSGTAPKASNRQIRRAFGPDVVKTLDRHADMLESVRTYLRLVEQRLQALERPSLWQRCCAWLGAR